MNGVTFFDSVCESSTRHLLSRIALIRSVVSPASLFVCFGFSPEQAPVWWQVGLFFLCHKYVLQSFGTLEFPFAGLYISFRSRSFTILAHEALFSCHVLFGT